MEPICTVNREGYALNEHILSLKEELTMFDFTDNETERVFAVKNEELQHFNILEERILDFVKKDSRDVILDLENLYLFDSVALAVLIRIKRKLAGMDRNFKLINYNQTILRVIELSGLDDFLLE